MSPATADEVVTLLVAWSRGDRSALDKLVPYVYADLRRMAQQYMRRERPGHSLQTTALVNEAYLRLTEYARMDWDGRAHFLAVAAQAMRRILVEHARRRGQRKRGAGISRVPLDDVATLSLSRSTDLLALDDALCALAALDERKSRVVELRFFGGLTVVETAEALKVSVPTILRDWSTAKAWLYRELTRRG